MSILNIKTEFPKALDDVIGFYSRKGITVKTPVSLRKSDKPILAIMQIYIHKNKEGISQQELMHKVFDYQIIAEFLDVSVSEEKIIDHILSKEKINNDEYKTEYAEITYHDILIRMLKNNTAPEKFFRDALSHEIWHLIESENGLFRNVIDEGTATYAMNVHQDTLYKLYYTYYRTNKTGKIKSFNELKYEYCAAIIRNKLHGSKDLQLLFDKGIREEVTKEYKKDARKYSKNILSSQMEKYPWYLRSRINEFLGIENKNPICIADIEQSQIYKELTINEQNKIINTYNYLTERIHKMK